MTTPDTSTDDSDNTDHRLPQQQESRAADSVVIKFSNDGLVLELEGDDVDLGTDLKVRNEHRLIAEFRRDAVDGWWFKSSVVSEPRSVYGED
ncbi:MAG: hypothetical protein OXT70_02770 [Chloroflexota bacterium]|nr:hypothetical protein [Chloroflexota bacterium]